MADFTNNQIRHTYQRVLQQDTSGVVQNGTGSADLGNVHISGSLYHTGSMNVSSDVTVGGNGIIPNITGSTTIAGTATAHEGLVGAFFANPQTLVKNISFPASHNGRMYGPITVGAGYELTVGSNSNLEIIDPL